MTASRGDPGPPWHAVSLPSQAWAPLLWFGALLLLCYARTLAPMAGAWLADEDMSHGLVVPFAVAYLVWGRLHQIKAAAGSPSAWGLLIAAAGLSMLLAGILGAWLFVMRVSLLVSVAGVLVAQGGFGMLRALAFPLALCGFMIPPPTFLSEGLTLPLQLLASQIAERTLDWFGYSVLREGNILDMAGQRLSVAEACSGLRSLFSLTFFSLVYGAEFDSRPFVKWVLMLVIIPVAIGVNALRIVITALLGPAHQALTHGIWHDVLGWSLFALAIGILALIHQGMKRGLAWRSR